MANGADGVTGGGAGNGGEAARERRRLPGSRVGATLGATAFAVAVTVSALGGTRAQPEETTHADALPSWAQGGHPDEDAWGMQTAAPPAAGASGTTASGTTAAPHAPAGRTGSGPALAAGAPADEPLPLAFGGSPVSAYLSAAPADPHQDTSGVLNMLSPPSAPRSAAAKPLAATLSPRLGPLQALSRAGTAKAAAPAEPAAQEPVRPFHQLADAPSVAVPAVMSSTPLGSLLAPSAENGSGSSAAHGEEADDESDLAAAKLTARAAAARSASSEDARQESSDGSTEQAATSKPATSKPAAPDTSPSESGPSESGPSESGPSESGPSDVIPLTPALMQGVTAREGSAPLVGRATTAPVAEIEKTPTEPATDLVPSDGTTPAQATSGQTDSGRSPSGRNAAGRATPDESSATVASPGASARPVSSSGPATSSSGEVTSVSSQAQSPVEETRPSAATPAASSPTPSSKSGRKKKHTAPDSARSGPSGAPAGATPRADAPLSRPTARQDASGSANGDSDAQQTDPGAATCSVDTSSLQLSPSYDSQDRLRSVTVSGFGSGCSGRTATLSIHGESSLSRSGKVHGSSITYSFSDPIAGSDITGINLSLR